MTEKFVTDCLIASRLHHGVYCQSEVEEAPGNEFLVTLGHDFDRIFAERLHRRYHDFVQPGVKQE